MADTNPAVNPTKEALPDLARIPDEVLREINSFEDAVKLASEVHGSVEDIADEIGNGFSIVKDKSRLIGKTFLFLDWRFLDGDYGDEGFVAASIVTKDNEKLILTDGSTGVRDQLADLTARTNKYGGYMVSRGLRESRYDTCTGSGDRDCGKPRKQSEATCSACGSTSTKRSTGVTYYLDNSK